MEDDADVEGDPRFWVLREALANYASDPGEPEGAPGETLVAAVSLILRGSDELELMVIKRARAEGDPWSGHMALPGGRWERSDESLLHTAVRETWEEVSIALGEAPAYHLGRLDEVAPRSTRLPRLSIHPFVFGIPADEEARPDAREVASVHWVPVSSLEGPDAVEWARFTLHGEARQFPCFRIEGEPVWGLTYGILQQFLEVWPSLSRRESEIDATDPDSP